MTPLIWSPQALRDIESIRAYIAQDSLRVADLVVARMIKAIERLRAFPESGRKVPELNDTEIREVIEPPYRIVSDSATPGRGRHRFPGLALIASSPIDGP